MANVRPASEVNEVTNNMHGKISKGRTQKNVYVQDPEMWQTFADKADEMGISMSELIYAGMRAFLNNECHTCARVREIVNVGKLGTCEIHGSIEVKAKK